MDDPMDGRCAGVTLAGHRCTRRATRPGSDTCASHDPARGVRVATAPRTCRRCGQTQPADHFSASGHGNGRRRVCIRCVRAAEAAKASRRRHPRVNARGEVWCNACQRYLPRDHFKPHPSRPGALWPYCTPCVRIKDRARYHKTKFRPDKAANAEERTRRKAARRAVEHRERRRVDGARRTRRSRPCWRPPRRCARTSRCAIAGRAVPCDHGIRPTPDHPRDRPPRPTARAAAQQPAAGRRRPLVRPGDGNHPLPYGRVLGGGGPTGDVRRRSAPDRAGRGGCLPRGVALGSLRGPETAPGPGCHPHGLQSGARRAGGRWGARGRRAGGDRGNPSARRTRATGGARVYGGDGVDGGDGVSEPVDVGCPHGHVWTEWWSLPDGTDHRACGQCGWVQRRPDGGTWTDAVVIDRATAVIAAEACATLVDGQTEKTRSALAMIESALAGTEG